MKLTLNLEQAMKTKGLTLIELCVVITIVGLMTQMLLMGQSAIHNARVHDIISQQDGIRAAWMGFADRYRALPGDYANASNALVCSPTCTNGNGNGRVEAAESQIVWQHLAAAGYISGEYHASSPRNVFGADITVVYDNAYGNGTNAPHHNIKTGNLVPGDILAEVDRKMDDGKPASGDFQFSSTGGTDADCNVVAGEWNLSAGNCGGATVLK